MNIEKFSNFNITETIKFLSFHVSEFQWNTNKNNNDLYTIISYLGVLCSCQNLSRKLIIIIFTLLQ